MSPPNIRRETFKRLAIAHVGKFSQETPTYPRVASLHPLVVSFKTPWRLAPGLPLAPGQLLSEPGKKQGPMIGVPTPSVPSHPNHTPLVVNDLQWGVYQLPKLHPGVGILWYTPQDFSVCIPHKNPFMSSEFTERGRTQPLTGHTASRRCTIQEATVSRRAPRVA